MQINPVYVDEKPFCNRKQCEMFSSIFEEGWGIAEKCCAWNEEQHGREPFVFSSEIVCIPALINKDA